MATGESSQEMARQAAKRHLRDSIEELIRDDRLYEPIQNQDIILELGQLEGENEPYFLLGTAYLNMREGNKTIEGWLEQNAGGDRQGSLAHLILLKGMRGQRYEDASEPYIRRIRNALRDCADDRNEDGVDADILKEILYLTENEINLQMLNRSAFIALERMNKPSEHI